MSEKVPDREAHSDALRAASERRIELKEAVSAAERAAAAPTAKPGWLDNLLVELDDLRIALDQHVEEVEAPDGLLGELAREAPRLMNQILRVRDEHPELQTEVAATIAKVKASDDVEEIRSVVLQTLISIARHRQRGADLVYDGYNVDIGGG